MSDTPSKIAFVAADTPQAADALARLKNRYAHVPVERADIVVALGGDGFVLQTLHRVLERGVPVFGMHRGSVGFLMNDFRPLGLIARLKAAHRVTLHPLRMTARAAWTARTALLAGTAFVLFGEMLARPGFAGELVGAAERSLGTGALAIAPLLAAFGGAMTGSALAANALALPLTLPLWDADALGGTGLQTAVAAAFTALSPARVALAVALVGLAGGLGTAYRALVPLFAALCVASALAFAFERI